MALSHPFSALQVPAMWASLWSKHLGHGATARTVLLWVPFGERFHPVHWKHKLCKIILLSCPGSVNQELRQGMKNVEEPTLHLPCLYICDCCLKGFPHHSSLGFASRDPTVFSYWGLCSSETRINEGRCSDGLHAYKENKFHRNIKIRQQLPVATVSWWSSEFWEEKPWQKEGS